MKKYNEYNTFFFPDEIVYMLKNYQYLNNKQLLEEINKNRVATKKLTLTLLRIKLYNLGLKRSEKPTPWNAIEVRFLIDNYKTKGNIEIATILNKFPNKTREFNKKIVEKKMTLLNLERSTDDLSQIRLNHKIKGAFKHGKTGIAKKYPEGKISIHNNRNSKTGKYFKRKVIFINGEQIAYARYVWKKYNGDIPSGYKVCFIDGDSLNCNITNLKISKTTRFRRDTSLKITADFFESQGSVTPGKFILKEKSIPKTSLV